MLARAGLQIVLVLALRAASAQEATVAPPPAPAADDLAGVEEIKADGDTYKQAQIVLYDTLRRDSSPDRQVLAGRLYVDDDDVPAALRPKRAEVVARAARLAPDDAFVQWMAADQGSYYSSQCGPTQWPETEVANLLRMEPDNAAALQFAVALAHAKGDQAALDEALVRMASAQRADDHLSDEIVAWRKTYVAHPDPLTFGSDANASADDKALLRALQQTGFHSAPTGSALEAACKPDAASERAWQRLGWCADAGVLLATRGNSFTLRELGLKMLAAAGATRDDLSDLQRQIDWLQANASNPMQNSEAFEDASSDRAADWQGGAGEITATERRLKRTGKPLMPPVGWTKAIDAEPEEDASAKSGRDAWNTYIATLVDALQGSANARERAVGLSTAKLTEQWFGDAATAAKAKESPPATAKPLVDLAAANPDDIIVQWVAATNLEGPQANAAKANAQRLDADNAAAWAFSLDAIASDATQTLQRMAASARYDDHAADTLTIWGATVGKHPLPQALLDTARMMSSIPSMSEDAAGKSTAIAMAGMTALGIATISNINAACRSPSAEASRKEACIAVGHRMLDSGRSLVTVMIGAQLLRTFDVLGPDDQTRARQIAWWGENLHELIGNGDTLVAFFDDYASTHSEIEALRLAATRAGKAEPPAGWQSPAEKQAARKSANTAKQK
jgi:hypothetical protein